MGHITRTAVVAAEALVIAMLLGGCNTVTNLWSGGPREQSKLRPGVVQLHCEGGKTLGLRREGNAAWIVLPEREFRLDAAPGQGERYSNGRTTLVVAGDRATVEEGGTQTFSGCRQPG